jgi:tetratricopeptide (TPR) repeat protein
MPAEALKYYKRCLERDTTLVSIFSSGYYSSIGWAYWQNGYKEKANYYFKKQIEYSDSEIELRRTPKEQFEKYWDLASVYSFMGEKEKAYNYLEIYNRKQIMSLYDVTGFRHFPFFDNIRNEPAFQKIVSDAEAKYQAEHERVRKWLEEQGML